MQSIRKLKIRNLIIKRKCDSDYFITFLRICVLKNTKNRKKEKQRGIIIKTEGEGREGEKKRGKSFLTTGGVGPVASVSNETLCEKS